jgi:hypothetical protein
LTAVQQIHIPDGRLRRQAFDADSALPFGARFASPHHPKLSLNFVLLDMENLARLDRANHSLQHGSTITDISDLRVLREGHGFGVDTPDAHGKECANASIPTTIHRSPFSRFMKSYVIA